MRVGKSSSQPRGGRKASGFSRAASFLPEPSLGSAVTTMCVFPLQRGPRAHIPVTPGSRNKLLHLRKHSSGGPPISTCQFQKSSISCHPGLWQRSLLSLGPVCPFSFRPIPSSFLSSSLVFSSNSNSVDSVSPVGVHGPGHLRTAVTVSTGWGTLSMSGVQSPGPRFPWFPACKI